MGSSEKAIRLLITGLFLWVFLLLSAQTIKKQEVDSLWWKQTTKDIEYVEEKSPANVQFNHPAFPTWLNRPVFMVLILILIVAILLFVLFKLFGKGLFVSEISEKKAATFLLSEEDLDDYFYEMDLDKMLAKSIAEQNWAMAIRIQFLMVIKKLISNEQIHWHKDLTNRQVAYQIKSLKSRKEFNNLVVHFEKVWYGDKVITFEYYTEIYPRFVNYQAAILSNEKK